MSPELVSDDQAGGPVTAGGGRAQDTEDLEIRLVGGVRCQYRGRRIELGGVLPRSLLAVLVLHPGQTLVKDTVIEVLWGQDPPLTADRLIADYLSRLRTALAPAASVIELRAMRPGFRAELDPDHAWVDIHRFRALLDQAQAAGDAGDLDHASGCLEQALDLWPEGAELMADLESAWLRGRAHALSGLRLTAVERLARLYLDVDRPQQALRVLRGTSPMERENLTALWIQALADAGESSRAAALARSSRDKLVASGRQPGQVLQAALDAVLGSATLGRAERGPRHLLPDTALFTGRDHEMGKLLTLAGQVGSGASPGAVVISAIDGMGGVGKTALALHAAHRLADQYPDGHLFINLAGFTAGRQPLDPSQALADLLRSLSIPPQLIPETLEARAAFYRDRLHGTRTLIVLDNAANENQVRPLLPGTGTCLVLITSRKRLSALDDALPLPLDVLAPAEAITLLRRAARLPATSHGGDDQDRLLEYVAELCGRLPLALLIAAALLRAHGRAWSLQHLINRLTTRPPGQELARFDDGIRNLTALFDISYHALTLAQQQFYRHLGVLPGPEIDSYAAAALLPSGLAEAEELLEQLADYSLLEAASPGRYRMHDLLRAHARTVADPYEQRQAARSRLFRYYQHTVWRAAVLTALIPRPGLDTSAPALAPTLPDTETAWAWLRTERANLQAAIDYAERHDLGPDLVTLAAGLATLLETDGPWPQAAGLHKTAAATAARLGDDLGQAGALTELGTLWRLTGDYPGSADAATQALQLYRNLGNRLGQATALAVLGRVRRLTGDYPGSVAAATQALQLYRDLGNCLGQATALIGLDRVRRLMGDYPGAADAAAQALRLYRDLGNSHGQANALADLGRVRRLTGDYAGAADAAAQALQAYRDLGDRLGETDVVADLGRVRRLTGDYAGAADAAAQALQAYRDLGDRVGQARALVDLGRVRRLTGDYPGAIDVLTQALQFYRDLDDRLGQADALVDLGRVRRLTGDYPGAIDVLTQALQAYRDLDSRGNEARALNHYAAAVAAGGDVIGALELYQQALAMTRELGQPDDEAIALEGIGNCLLTQGHTTAGIIHLQQAWVLYQRLGMHADNERLTTRLLALPAPTSTTPPEPG